MKVLLGWELGAGQGHIQRLTAIASHLAAQGWEPIFALKSYDLKGIDFPWQSLVPPCLPFSGREDSYRFADILATFGFEQVDLLRAHLHDWQTILKTVNPQLVIADHAPGLVLAAHGLLPIVTVGSHFAVPPPVEEFPIFRFPAPPESDERQLRVSETVQQLVRLNMPLGQALNGDYSFIFSLPELDYYRVWRQPAQTRYVGIQIAPLPRNHPTAAAKTWAYLSSDYANYEEVLNTLNAASEFRPLHEVLTDLSVAVHHGGLTTTIACLLAGVPQLILPRHVEQQLTATALMQLGAAQMYIEPTWEDLLMAQIQVSQLVDRAQTLADRLSRWNQNFLDIVTQTCFDLVS